MPGIEGFRGGVPVGVAEPDTDERDATARPRRESRILIARAVVRHFHDIDAQVRLGGDDGCLGLNLDIAGQEKRGACGLEDDADARVVRH